MKNNDERGTHTVVNLILPQTANGKEEIKHEDTSQKQTSHDIGTVSNK